MNGDTCTPMCDSDEQSVSFLTCVYQPGDDLSELVGHHQCLPLSMDAEILKDTPYNIWGAFQISVAMTGESQDLSTKDVLDAMTSGFNVTSDVFQKLHVTELGDTANVGDGSDRRLENGLHDYIIEYHVQSVGEVTITELKRISESLMQNTSLQHERFAASLVSQVGAVVLSFKELHKPTLIRSVHSPVPGTGDTEAEPEAGNNHSLIGVAIAISNVLLCFCCCAVWRLFRRRRSSGDDVSDSSRSAFGMLPGFGDKEKKQSANDDILVQMFEEEGDEPPQPALYSFEPKCSTKVSAKVPDEGLDIMV